MSGIDDLRGARSKAPCVQGDQLLVGLTKKKKKRKKKEDRSEANQDGMPKGHEGPQGQW